VEFILGVIAGFALSFFSEAGKDFYSYCKTKINPPEHKPVQRDSRFQPEEIKDKDPIGWLKTGHIILKEQDLISTELKK
jgi:hypothetical protein